MDRDCVLAVDDDPVFLKIVVATLKSAGYKVMTAPDLASAKSVLGAGGAERFSCALIDFRLPDGNGSELLRWLRPHESGVAAIIVTASGERSLIRQTMVEGACNFLEKPVSPRELRSAVALALSTTSPRRRLAETSRQVESAAQVQARLLSAISSTDVLVEYKFRPKNACGGDFLIHHKMPDGAEAFILSDVAGHDIAASVQSAFFHGWITGLLKNGAEVESVLDGFNRLLLEPQGDAAGSIAVTALKIQPELNCMTAWNFGGLPPVFVDWWGAVQWMGARSSAPLGWFETTRRTKASTGIPPSPVWIWTDGLESLADSIGAASLSVAYALLATGSGDDPLWLGWAEDDILVSRIWPHSSAGFQAPSCFHPLVAEEYDAEEVKGIDQIQARWKTSLGIALPEMPAGTAHDVLLAAREVVLNAVTYGCFGCERAAFHMLYNPGERVLRVRVADPGPGHTFDWRTEASAEPPGQHCGLLMVHSMASRVTRKRNGAELIIDFILSPELKIIRNEDLA